MDRSRLAVIGCICLLFGILIGMFIVDRSSTGGSDVGGTDKNTAAPGKRSTKVSSATHPVQDGRKRPLSRKPAPKLPAKPAEQKPPRAPQGVSDGLPASGNTVAGDSPAFRGPNGDGTYPDGNIGTDWKENAPKILWSRDVGYGFSGVAIAGKKVVTAGYNPEGNKSFLICLDADSGKTLWQAEYADSLAGPRGNLCGPVATPAISEDKVYMVATAGAAYCFDLNTGANIWEKVANKVGIMCGDFGDGASPVVYGDTIIVHLSTGAEAASWFALRKSDGSVVWSLPVNSRLGAGDPLVDRSFSPVAICKVDGMPAALLISDTAIECVDPANGTKMWSFSISDLEMRYGPFGGAVFFDADKFLLETWYAKRPNVVAYQITATGLTQLWTSKAIGKGAYSCVVCNGMAFGYGVEGLNCVDLMDGKSKWKWRSSDPKLAKDQGEVILVGDKLVWISSSGTLYIGDAVPEKHAFLGEFKALKDCYKDLKKDNARYNNIVSTSPAFANGHVYLRSPWGEIACVEFNGAE